jgi:ubiquinol-cytochrome c reductase cytochrome c1 subunit
MIKLGAAALALTVGATAASAASYPKKKPREQDWSFAGVFGHYDKAQLQRGLKVYVENCSACHSMKRVSFRNLSALGYSEEQVESIAGQYTVEDGPNEDGDMFERTATPADLFPSPFANREAATAALGAYPPDMSLIAKARAGFSGPYGTGLAQLFKGMGGPEYIASLLQGYTGETKTQAGTTLYENTVYEGGWIAMAQPLYGDDVEYADGTPATIEQQSKDVAAFLMWAAEPKMMARKEAGLTAVIFLTVLTVLLYLTNKRLWQPVKNRAKQQAQTPAE